ncbi:seed maturation protein [Sesamum alatum]|uniref:Seed maturation protein n=1 Tax=Sesamum alatum TaxID=300844 RepID=A0AAE2C8K9_9LAMI|nr:seed maturation protein [Sesamum alatum]
MQSIKETVLNVAAAANSGMEKTKAIVQEQVDQMTGHNDTETGLATQRKEERILQADLDELEAIVHNAAARQAASEADGYSRPATGRTEHPAIAHQTSTGQPSEETVNPASGHQMSTVAAIGHPAGGQ